MKRSVFTLTAALLGSAAVAQTTVEFWHVFGSGASGDFLNRKAQEFSARNPGVRVVPVYKGSYEDLLQAAILAGRQGKAPALSMILELGTQLAYDSGVFQPVQDIGGIRAADFLQPATTYYTINGKLVSVPYNATTVVMYTNKTLMKKAGLNPDRPPQTFSAMKAACAQIERAKLGVSCFGMSLHAWFMEEWMAQQGAPLVNNNNGRTARATAASIDSPAGRRVYQFLKDLNDRKWWLHTGKIEDWDGSNALFQQQKVVFHLTSSPYIPGWVDDAKQNNYDLGVADMPIPDGVKRNGQAVAGGSLWVAKNIPPERARAALAFAQYLTNPQNMAEWSKLTGYYPVTAASAQQLQRSGFFRNAPAQQASFDMWRRTTPNSATGGALTGVPLELRRVIEESWQQLTRGQSVDAAVKQAQARANAAIRKYNQNFR